MVSAQRNCGIEELMDKSMSIFENSEEGEKVAMMKEKNTERRSKSGNTKKEKRKKECGKIEKKKKHRKQLRKENKNFRRKLHQKQKS